MWLYIYIKIKQARIVPNKTGMFIYIKWYTCFSLKIKVKKYPENSTIKQQDKIL